MGHRWVTAKSYW